MEKGTLQKIRRFVARLTARQGSIINLALLVLVLLNIIVIGASKIASTNVKIATNDKMSKTALFHAESGVDEAIARLSTFSNAVNDPATAQKYDPLWRGFVGTAANAVGKYPTDYAAASANGTLVVLASAQTELDYTVMLRKKLESDLPGGGQDKNADGDKNDVLVWNYADSVLGSKNDGDALEIGLFLLYVIHSKATFTDVEREVEVELVTENDMVIPSNALFTNLGIDSGGNAADINGQAYAKCKDVPDVGTSSNTPDYDPTCKGKCPPNYNASGNDNIAANPTDPLALADDLAPIDVATQAASLCSGSDVITIPPALPKGSTTYYGSATDFDGIYCTDPSDTGGDLDGQNLSGYGVLVVRGDFDVSGNIGWNGIIIVEGTTSLTGGGKLVIEGALLGNDIAQIQGDIELNYNCDVINNLANGTNAEREIARWQDF